VRNYDEAVSSPVDEGRSSRIHPLEIPFIWFGIQFVELVVVIPAVFALVPDAWSEGLRWAVLIAVVAALTVANYAIRRRFIPR
jgi:drug/metabolite transporter (DMT)-like permease